jgi:antitoxin HicB
MDYPVILERDDNDTILVSFPDFPEAHTFGNDVEDALERAPDALATAIDAYIKDRRDVPLPSAIITKYRVALPALVETKVRLYETMRGAKVGKSELAKRLKWHLPQVDRLLEMTHGSKLEQLEAAFTVLGKRLVVGIEDIPSAPHRRSEVKERTRKRVRRRVARTNEVAASAKRMMKKHRRSLERLAK